MKYIGTLRSTHIFPFTLFFSVSSQSQPLSDVQSYGHQLVN